jgi:hypothetical protein
VIIRVNNSISLCVLSASSEAGGEIFSVIQHSHQKELEISWGGVNRAGRYLWGNFTNEHRPKNFKEIYDEKDLYVVCNGSLRIHSCNGTVGCWKSDF